MRSLFILILFCAVCPSRGWTQDNGQLTYENRLLQQIVQLSDYLDVLCNEVSNRESRDYYAKKAKSLFMHGSSVTINGYDTLSLPVDSFFNALVRREIVIKSLDSVTVPKWKEHNQQDSIIWNDGQIYSFERLEACSHAAIKLPLRKEITEDGEEWLPVFGNLVVCVDTLSKPLPPTSKPSRPLNPMNAADWVQLSGILYKTKIKLVDEFFDRFNGVELRVDVDTLDSTYREKNMLLLFNGQLFKSFEDSLFDEARRMVQFALNNNVRIDYADTTWHAEALCCGKLNGKQVDFTVHLQVEHRRDNMYKWVISRVEGEAFGLKPDLRTERLMLMPDDHETNFMSLHRITTEKDNYITNYAQKTFVLDQTSVFYALVYSGFLDIEGVNELKFVFRQIPDYEFTIKYFERDSFNSGWLIDSFRRIK